MTTTTAHHKRRPDSAWIARHRFVSAVVREIFPVAAAPTSWQEGHDVPVRPTTRSAS